MSEQFPLNFEDIEARLKQVEAEYAKATNLPPIREGTAEERLRLMEVGLRDPDTEIRRRTLEALKEDKEDVEATYRRGRAH